MPGHSASTIAVIVAIGLWLETGSASAQPPPPPPAPARIPSDRQVAPSPAEAVAAEGLFFPEDLPFPSRSIAGLPERASAGLLTWRRVHELALVRTRSGEKGFAESLDPQALAEQVRRHGVDDFQRFRKEFRDDSFRDPAEAYLGLLRKLEEIDNARRHIRKIENMDRLFRELIQGENRGLSQLDLDLMGEILTRARRGLSGEIARYRDALDELKVALGLSPHAAVLPDRREMAAFRAVWAQQESWNKVHPEVACADLPPTQVFVYQHADDLTPPARVSSHGSPGSSA